jgi:hypothetical protein
MPAGSRYASGAAIVTVGVTLASARRSSRERPSILQPDSRTDGR